MRVSERWQRVSRRSNSGELLCLLLLFLWLRPFRVPVRPRRLPLSLPASLRLAVLYKGQCRDLSTTRCALRSR
jgi:hypothetical protein